MRLMASSSSGFLSRHACQIQHKDNTSNHQARNKDTTVQKLDMNEVDCAAHQRKCLTASPNWPSLRLAASPPTSGFSSRGRVNRIRNDKKKC